MTNSLLIINDFYTNVNYFITLSRQAEAPILSRSDCLQNSSKEEFLYAVNVCLLPAELFQPLFAQDGAVNNIRQLVRGKQAELFAKGSLV